MHQIDRKINWWNWYEWLKEQVTNTFSKQLKGFQNGLLSDHLEKQINVGNTINVLEKAFIEFSKNNSFSTVFTNTNSTVHSWWYTLALQYWLHKLWYNPWSLDGIYRSAWKNTSKTREAVKQFQIQWNKNNPQDVITVDWRAGKNTLERLIGELGKINKPKPPAPIKKPVKIKPIKTPPIDTSEQKPSPIINIPEEKSEFEKSEELIESINAFDIRKKAKFRYSYLMSKTIRWWEYSINTDSWSIKANVYFMCKKWNKKNPPYYIWIDKNDPKKIYIWKMWYKNKGFSNKCTLEKVFETFVLNWKDKDENNKIIQDKINLIYKN